MDIVKPTPQKKTRAKIEPKKPAVDQKLEITADKPVAPTPTIKAYSPPVTQPESVKKTRFAWIKKKPTKKQLLVTVGISAGILAVGVIGLILFGPKPASPNPDPIVESNYVPPPTTEASQLTGVQVPIGTTNLRPITAIMIENSVDARPQSGLEQAGIVFEAIAEGGITRFLALYQEAQPDYVGPIRSARPYYVEWAKGFDAAYVHSGGSGEALALIQSLGVKDMDHGKYGNAYFDRASNRYAPHNVYTSMARMDELRGVAGFTDASVFESFARKADTPVVTPDARTIAFNISGQLYNTSYTYVPETNSYARVLAGQPHTDERTGKQITPKNVVALIATYGIHPDGVHSKYGTIGSGKVLVFMDGTVKTGTWHKPTQSSSLTFTDENGEPMMLDAGQTWITAIPEERVSFGP